MKRFQAILIAARCSNCGNLTGRIILPAPPCPSRKRDRSPEKGPATTFRASQSAPYPWFAPGPIAATRRACPDLEAESRFFAALSEMTLIEAQGDTVILTNEAGREMVFRRSQD